MNVELVLQPFVDRVWPQIAEKIDTAAKKTGGDLTAGYLWQECRSGHAFLIIAYTGTTVVGASIWRFETWQSGAKFRCLAAAGTDLGDWIEPMHEKVLEVARSGGAGGLVYEGREGWRRVRKHARAIRTLYEEAI